MNLKIHIVQKDETLWIIAQKYGVSLDELIASNTQLSNPEQIMPGMKIKIPYTQMNKYPHSDKSKKEEKKHIPNQTMPPIQEDEKIDCAPLEKEMPSLPMQFYPQVQPHLPSQSLPNVAQPCNWEQATHQHETSHHPLGMNGHHKGEYQNMNHEQMYPMPYPGQQPPSMGPSNQAHMPYQQPPQQQMQGYQGMQPPHMGYYPNQQPMGSPNNPYPNNMPQAGCGHQQYPMQQPMMQPPVAGAQQMMPPQGMHPAMTPAMPPYQHPGYPSPYHHGPYNDCGCGGPGPREDE